MTSAVGIGPDSWVPGQRPDPVSERRGDLIGAPVSRLDGVAKVTGAARFAAEVPVPGMAYAALAFGTIARGRIATLDTSAAEAAPGVVLVMTYRNAPRLNPPPKVGSNLRAASADDLPVMQDSEIHWNGQPIALVLAETEEQANHAASLIRATYETAPATTSFREAKQESRDAPPFHGRSLAERVGHAEAALATAPHRVEVAFRTPRHHHAAIELHAATAVWSGGRLTVHDSTMNLAHTAWSLAQIFGLEEDQVHVLSPYVGGSFGGKKLWQHHVLAAAAAKLASRPVRLVLSREGVHRAVGGRTTTEQRVAIGAAANGRFEALIHTGTVALSRHNDGPAEPFIMPSQCLYATANLELEVRVAAMDMVANTFMRAPGEAVGTFALECAVDELAEQIGIDPIDLRLRNDTARSPSNGRPFSSRHLAEAFRMGAERFGWDQRDAHPGAHRDGEWLIGLGCAAATYPHFRFPGGAARITLIADGHATVAVAAHEMGMGTATIHTQVAAARLGLPLERVTFAYGDSSYPGVIIAAGSQQTAAVGGAVIAAHRELVAELLRLAGDESPLAGLEPGQVGGRDGGLCSLLEPDRHETYAAILSRAQRSEVTVDASAPPPAEQAHWSLHSFGAQFCEVRVSAVTGEILVTRFLGSYDCGRILNAKTAASQLRGGIIMGLGLALMEETHYDERNGRIVNPSLSEYHVPVHPDVPEIDVMWTDIPDPHTPMGARGVGEIGITGVGAAVANAVYNAAGTRVRELPITVDRLHHAGLTAHD